MVAVRSAHINKAGEFDPEKWIASLGITSQKSCECLAETWAYCLQQTQGHPDASLLLWRVVADSRRIRQNEDSVAFRVPGYRLTGVRL